MRKEAGGKGKEMAPKNTKPAVLSAEAAAMEQKLVELRKAMEKERAKREALMANTTGGSIWRNGGSASGLRSNVKGKGPGEGSPASAAGSSATSSSRRPASMEPTTTATAASASSSGGGGRASSARSAGAAAESEMPASLSGSRLTTSGRAANSEPTKGAGALAGRGAAASSSGGGGGGGAVGGMSCGTDDNSSLADGAFNEADSHKSFLDALNEWRRANRGDTPADAGAASSSGSGGPQQQQLRPRSANPLQAPVASASLEVQTESRPASRPSSAKPLSYFDKLVINASSRVAGHLASGGPLESLRGSLSGQATGLPRPSSALRPLSANAPSASATAAAAAPPGAAPAKPPPAATSASDPGPIKSSGGGAPDPLSILDRLEALEAQRREAVAGEDDEEEAPGGGSGSLIQVTTATGVVLTKGARLPDEVLMPPNEAC